MNFLDRLTALDIWIMSLFGGLSQETLSSAAWNAHIAGRFWGWTHHIIDLLFYIWERDHCQKDWEFRKSIYGK